jgi:hypothetical protein
MICYKDKTFCSASGTRCKNESCCRFLSEAEGIRAQMHELPIAYSDFSVGCKEIVTNANQT